MAESLVQLELDGHVATLTLDRPAKLNALTPQLFEDFAAKLDSLLTAEKEIRCVVVTGSGSSFCAGHDLGSVASNEAEQNRYREAEIIDRLESLPIPTIAKIRGHCLTGGLELALGCDLLLAAESASFADTHGRWGLAPVWGMSVRLPERVGLARAKELSFTSRRVSGSVAAQIGLVDRCVADEQLDAAVEDLAAEIVANSVGTNRIYKSLYAQQSQLDRRASLLAERDLPFGMPDDSQSRLAAR